MKFMTLDTLVFTEKLDYYDSERITKKFSKNGISYVIFKLYKFLSTEEKTNLLNKYNNIDFGIVKKEYAPEIKHTAILIFDKPIR